MNHIAACLGYGGQHKKVLVSGGWNGDNVISDTWLLDPQSWRWEEVRRELLYSLYQLLNGVCFSDLLTNELAKLYIQVKRKRRLIII